MSFEKILQNLRKEGYSNRYGSYRSWVSVRTIVHNDVYTGRIKFKDVIVENEHEAIISKEQFQAVQAMIKIRQDQYGNHGFQSKHLLTGMLICGYCGARYYKHRADKYAYYCCYSYMHKASTMSKNPDCKNKHWRARELEAIIEERVRELLMSPQMVKDIASAHKPESVVNSGNNKKIEQRLREIDKQIGRLMELYQVEGIPAEILGENINKLYHEKTALESSFVPVEEIETVPFDFIEDLIHDAAQIWDFADDAQKRRVLQGLIKRIVLTGDDVAIEWTF